jgi:hypothetical protein
MATEAALARLISANMPGFRKLFDELTGRDGSGTTVGEAEFLRLLGEVCPVRPH